MLLQFLILRSVRRTVLSDLRVFGFLAACLASTAGLAQMQPIAAAGPDLIETGVPSFVVLGPEALGISGTPIHLKQMPDGRLLAVGHNELALGDGVRWQVFRKTEGRDSPGIFGVAVDKEGEIFVGLPGGFARVDFSSDGHWRLTRLDGLPPEVGTNFPTLTHVEAVGGQWLWWFGGGPVVAWQPGTVARVVGRTNAPERAFILNNKIHLSDAATGSLYRVDNGTLVEVAPSKAKWAADTITCAVSLDGGQEFLGTISRGIIAADGPSWRPLATRGLLSGEHRINDLCATEGGLLAAALDNFGVVFFDRTGRIVQVLDRSIDHRLARPTRLIRSPGGTLWALLGEGLARISFPARLSYFEPMVPTGLAYAQPFRFHGRLWLMSDGKAQRAVYDSDNRLTHFEIDTPPDGYLGNLTEIDGRMIAGGVDGLYEHVEGTGWSRIITGIDSPYVRAQPVDKGRWLYAAKGEIGWLLGENGKFSTERFPEPGLGHVYGGTTDRDGVFWLELGPSKVGMVRPTLPRPTLEIFGPESGLPEGWAQVFVIDGKARINVPPRILTLDASNHRLVEDGSFCCRSRNSMGPWAGRFRIPRAGFGLQTTTESSSLA